ncbi:MAG TPA: DUF2156 domain-containing protein [Candidatus Limnocylindrales bacterium]
MGPAADPLLLALSAVGFWAVALGLLRGKHVSWWFAVATFALALFAQSSLLADPLESIAIGGALAVLVADRGRYRIETRASWRPWLVGLLAVGALAVAAETALVLAATGSWPAPLSILSRATAALGDMFGVDDDTAASILHVASRGGLVTVLLVAARLPVALAALGVLGRIPEPPADPSVRSRARDIARVHGQGALLPFQLGEDKATFCPPDLDACVVYGLAGRTAVVLGDPIAEARTLDRALTAFLDRSRALDRLAVVYQASAALRPALVAAGYRIFRVGAEAIVDLPSFDLAGGPRANLRHTIARARRGGIAVRWFPDGLGGETASLLPALVEVDRGWRRRAMPRLGFSIGSLDPDALASLPLAVATDAAGTPIAFATFRPTGARGGWVLDLMRRLPGATPGALESCIAAAALALRDRGAPTLSLGLAPLAGPAPGPTSHAERLLAAVARLVRPWYDVRGLAFFKGKFDPRWEPRFGAVPSWWALPGMTLALLRLHVRAGARGRSATGLLDPAEGAVPAPAEVGS